MYFSCSVSQAQIMIQNDSMKIKQQLFSIWEINPTHAQPSLIIKGISNNYSFPGMIKDKKHKNVEYFDDRDSIINLKSGIYIASITQTHTNRLFMFCVEDKIQVIADDDVKKIFEYYLYYCKINNYNDRKFVNELRKILDWVEKSQTESDSYE